MFYIPRWCGPCKILAPRLERLVGTEPGVHLAKIDVDENEDLAAEYQVSSIPAVYAFKDGKVLDSFVGVKDEDELKAFVKKMTG